MPANGGYMSPINEENPQTPSAAGGSPPGGNGGGNGGEEESHGDPTLIRTGR